MAHLDRLRRGLLVPDRVLHPIFRPSPMAPSSAPREGGLFRTQLLVAMMVAILISACTFYAFGKSSMQTSATAIRSGQAGRGAEPTTMQTSNPVAGSNSNTSFSASVSSTRPPSSWAGGEALRWIQTSRESGKSTSDQCEEQFGLTFINRWHVRASSPSTYLHLCLVPFPSHL